MAPVPAPTALQPRSGFEGVSCSCSSLAVQPTARRAASDALALAQIPSQGPLLIPCRLRTCHHPAILPALEDPLRHARLPRGAVRADWVHRQHLPRPHPETAHLRLPPRQSWEPMQTHCVVAQVCPPRPRCPRLPARTAEHRAPGHLRQCARARRRLRRRPGKGQEPQGCRRRLPHLLRGDAGWGCQGAAGLVQGRMWPEYRA